MALLAPLFMLLVSQQPKLKRKFLAKELDFGGTTYRTLEWSRTERSELLFLGSSTCYSGIDPRLFDESGLSSFSLCSTAQTLSQSLRILKRVVETSKAPEYLVLDVFPSLWKMPTSAVSTRDLVANGYYPDAADFRSIALLALKEGDPFAVMLAAYYSIYRQSNPVSNDRIPDSTGDYRGRGFVARIKEPLLKAPPIQPEQAKWARAHKKALLAIAELCEAHSIQLVLLVAPQLVRTRFELPEELAHLAFIDGMDWPGSRTAGHFYDNDHLIGSAAQSYSAWLADRVDAVLMSERVRAR